MILNKPKLYRPQNLWDKIIEPGDDEEPVMYINPDFMEPLPSVENIIGSATRNYEDVTGHVRGGIFGKRKYAEPEAEGDRGTLGNPIVERREDPDTGAMIDARLVRVGDGWKAYTEKEYDDVIKLHKQDMVDPNAVVVLPDKRDLFNPENEKLRRGFDNAVERERIREASLRKALQEAEAKADEEAKAKAEAEAKTKADEAAKAQRVEDLKPASTPLTILPEDTPEVRMSKEQYNNKLKELERSSKLGASGFDEKTRAAYEALKDIAGTDGSASGVIPNYAAQAEADAIRAAQIEANKKRYEEAKKRVDEYNRDISMINNESGGQIIGTPQHDQQTADVTPYENTHSSTSWAPQVPGIVVPSPPQDPPVTIVPGINASVTTRSKVPTSTQKSKDPEVYYPSMGADGTMGQYASMWNMFKNPLSAQLIGLTRNAAAAVANATQASNTVFKDGASIVKKPLTYNVFDPNTQKVVKQTTTYEQAFGSFLDKFAIDMGLVEGSNPVLIKTGRKYANGREMYALNPEFVFDIDSSGYVQKVDANGNIVSGPNAVGRPIINENKTRVLDKLFTAAAQATVRGFASGNQVYNSVLSDNDLNALLTQLNTPYQKYTARADQLDAVTFYPQALVFANFLARLMDSDVAKNNKRVIRKK